MNKFADTWKKRHSYKKDEDTHEKKDMGIAAGGPIPASLLAEQDLEGSKTTKSQADYKRLAELRQGLSDRRNSGLDVAKLNIEIRRLEAKVNKDSGHPGFTTGYELAARIKANQKVKARPGSNFKDFWASVRATNKV